MSADETALPDTASHANPARARTRSRTLLRVAPGLLLVIVALTGPWLAAHPIDTPVTAPYAAAGDGALLGGDQLGRDVLKPAAPRRHRTDRGRPAHRRRRHRPRHRRRLRGRPAPQARPRHRAHGRRLHPAAAGAGDHAHRPGLAGRRTLGRHRRGHRPRYPVRHPHRRLRSRPAGIGFYYVEAATARGERTAYIALRELLPNLRATVLALFGLRFVEAVYVISMAGFLQIGPQPPAADWALMIRENAPGILLNPWAVLAPSLAIAVLAISFNLASASLASRSALKAVTTS